MSTEPPARIAINSDTDIVAARAQGRKLAGQLGFNSTDATVIATAVSEVARNIVQHAGQGQIEFDEVRDQNRVGIRIVARDRGPGIADVEKALQPGYSTSSSLGLGLPGAKRLMDAFDIKSEPGKGTTVTMTKWNR